MKDFSRQHWLEYDHLVIAMGLSTDLSQVPGMADHSLPMRTLGDAIFLRNELINKLEMAAIEKNPDVKQKLLTFVCVGGGFSGVETLGEIADMIKAAIKHYPSISFHDVRLLLIHNSDRILLELGEKLAHFAHRKLERRGIDIRLNTKVEEVSSESVILSSKEVIPTNTIICTAGNAPHKVLQALPFINDKGRLNTNEFLQVISPTDNNAVVTNIWAIGDCAFIPNIKEQKHNPDALCPNRPICGTMAPVLGKIYSNH